ncbi:hypothetical protein [Aliamphritea spongicola]|nr:hypothetical protein [Aliamphritea spongicola]
MARAQAEVVPVTLNDDVNISAWEGKQDITMRLMHAIAAGCRAEPSLNAWFDGPGWPDGCTARFISAWRLILNRGCLCLS